MGADCPEILEHLQQTPVPPSEGSDNSVPPALENLVLWCLANRPADRPDSAAELAQALDAVAVEPWREEQAEREA